MDQAKIDRHLSSVRDQLAVLESEMRFRSEELRVLRGIDQRILETSGKAFSESENLVQELFLQTSQYITNNLIRNGVCAFYTNQDTHFQILGELRPLNKPMPMYEFPTEVRCSVGSIDWKDVETNSRFLKNDGSAFSKAFDGWDRIYVEPLFVHQQSLLGAFVVLEQCTAGDDHCQLDDTDAVDTFRGIFAQLKVAYKFLVEHQLRVEIAELWQIFAEQDLSPFVCFGILAHEIPNLMPKFGGHEFPPDVEIQIPMRRVEDNQLRIRASTGASRDTDIILIDDSISGIPFLEDGRLVNVDPTEPKYTGLYKSYFGSAEEKIRTEVVLPMKFKGEVVGVINLESFKRRAFSEIQIEILARIAEHLAPVVIGLEARLAQNRGVQTAYGSIISRYLNGFGKVLRHGIMSPVAALAADLDTLDLQLSRQEVDLLAVQDSIQRLRINFRSIKKSISDFTEDLSSYGAIEPLDLVELAKETIGIVEDTMRPKRAPGSDSATSTFEIDFLPSLRPTVRASRLFKPYLLALVDNSIRSIQKKQQLGRSKAPGRIRISIEADPGKKDRILFILRDTGNGVPREQLRMLERFRFGTRFREDVGEGYGLAATQRYLSTIDGWMEIDSVAGKFFEVRMSLRVEKPLGQR